MKPAILCICLLQFAAVNCRLTARDKTHLVKIKRTDNNLSSNYFTVKEIELWNQAKPRRLFARRGIQEHQRLHVTVKPAPPTPHCSKVMESCIPHSRCCDPCASCHCRFFNSICYCWKLGCHCQKKS
ncbi:agouti-signaling protein-like [Oncorhynchus nerka]|uniref:agouti-signaling protein-like n=1 Tax=Oncorhynchus nerka TaxID=8023 RepID=UPI00112FD6DF|nr:agouti-signaling protein-like [Oncorhynchus nerka]